MLMPKIWDTSPTPTSPTPHQTNRHVEVIPFYGVVAFGQVIPLKTAPSEHNPAQTEGGISVNNPINASNSKRHKFHKRHPRPLPRRGPQPGQMNRGQ